MDSSAAEPALEVALRDVAWVSSLTRRLARDGEAEDLAQDTWLAALEAPGRARGLRQWLSGVARFLAARRQRRARPEPSDALDSRPGKGLTDELVQQAEFQERVLAAVRALRAYRAAGRVLDADGHAVEGVLVKSSVFGTEPALAAPDGTFELVDLPVGAHTLWITLSDDTKAGPFTLSIGEAAADPIELRLPPR